MLKIRNWDKWQSYRKDRGTPPWIKVHRNLMSNPEWVMLSDSEKGQVVSLWLLAADRQGEIPDSAAIIKKMCMLDSVPDLNKFKELGFLENLGCQVDANMTSDSRPNDAPETETETETETEVRAKPKRFTPPSQNDVDDYMKEKGIVQHRSQSESFVDFYASKNWMVGKNKMKDWKAAVRNWIKRGKLEIDHNRIKREAWQERQTYDHEEALIFEPEPVKELSEEQRLKNQQHTQDLLGSLSDGIKLN